MFWVEGIAYAKAWSGERRMEDLKDTKLRRRVVGEVTLKS